MSDRYPHHQVVQYGEHQIEFSLYYAERKTLRILVQPDGRVQVIAPFQAREDDILQKIKSKARWILRQQAFFQDFQPATPPRQYVNGEAHLYLGKKYRLRIEPSDKWGVRCLRGYMTVYTTPKHSVPELIRAWYAERAAYQFPRILKDCLALFEAYNIPEPILEIRKMEKRWGSCTPKGKIRLNVELIKAPKACIEYVMIHELCHLVVPNHKRTFYSLLGKMMPDWEVWKGRLERVMA